MSQEEVLREVPLPEGFDAERFANTVFELARGTGTVAQSVGLQAYRTEMEPGLLRLRAQIRAFIGATPARFSLWKMLTDEFLADENPAALAAMERDLARGLLEGVGQ